MEKALDFLRLHNEVALATCEDGQPAIRIFQIMRMDGTVLYFATSPEKAVYRQLQRNPHIELLSFAGQISVRCSGTVNFDVDGETRRWIYQNNPVLPRLYTGYDKLAYFSLPIAEMDYYDLNPTPPLFLHYNLITGETGNGFVGERFSKK